MKGGNSMKKEFVILAGVILMLSLVAAAGQGGVHEPGTGIDSPDLKADAQGTGQGSGSGQAAQNSTEGQKLQLQTGEHTGEDGQQMKVQQQSNNRVRLEVGGKSAESFMNIKQETVNGKAKLSTQLSNGKNTEIKIMPDAASETALERLRLKNCSEEQECSIELKEVGSGENVKAAYEIKTQRTSRIFGLFGARMRVQAQVDAETGEIIRVNKPWWAFLASEPAE